MKYIITESQYNKAIDKFITYHLEPHEEKTSKEYPESIFWVKDGLAIVRIKKKSEFFWVNSNIWNTISLMFSLDENETQEVIKEWLENHYKLGSLIPFTSRASVMSSSEFANNLEQIKL
jgi:hypothetical protein